MSCILILLMFALSACTERNVQISSLGKIITGDVQFKVTNAVNDGNDLLPDAPLQFIPMEVSCSNSILGIEVRQAGTQDWYSVKALQSQAVVDCEANGVANFGIPLDHVAPYSEEPTTPGAQRKDFQVRWLVKSKFGENFYQQRTYSALFQPPTVTVNAVDINLANKAEPYAVSGTCSLNGAYVSIHSDLFTDEVLCENGVYSFSYDASGISDGFVTFVVKHKSLTSSRAYGQASKDIVIDVVPPAVTIVTPTSGAILNLASLIDGKYIAVSGACEVPNMPIKVKAGGVQVKQSVCPASGIYNEQIETTKEGIFDIEVEHIDKVGNLSHAIVSVQKDSIPPAAFFISSAVNSDFQLTVSYSNSGTGNGYSIKVKNNGNEVCQGTSPSVTAVITCPLVMAQTYDIYVTANDNVDNKTEAINNPYSFTPIFVAPLVTGISSSMADGSYKAGTTIPLTVTFDRYVSYLGNPELSLDIMGAKATIISAPLPANQLQFEYVVQPGDNSPRLEVRGVSGQIADANTGMPAFIVNIGSLPFAPNINIDTIAPAMPTLTLGESLYYHKSPVITYSDDPDVVSKTLSIEARSSGASVGVPTTPTASPFTYGGIVLEEDSNYDILLKVADAAGNETVARVGFTSFKCPLDFLYVYDQVQNNRPFCVAPFEAKEIDINLKPVFKAANPPIATGLSRDIAAGYCRKLGVGYDLPGTLEWNVTARLVASMNSNWTGGAVGLGSLIQGAVAEDLPLPLVSMTAVDLGFPCSHSSCTAGNLSNNRYRRYFDLPRNQKIYDLSGNAMEITYDLDGDTYSPSNVNVFDATPTSLIRVVYGAASLPSCDDDIGNLLNFKCGYGKYNFPSGHQTVFRGSKYNSGNTGGLFSADRSFGPTDIIDGPGFRCVYKP